MDGPYRAEWTPTAKRDVARLPEKVATPVVEFVYGALWDNPQRVGRALHLDLAGFHAARRGDFRVIYSIDPPEHRVVIRRSATARMPTACGEAARPGPQTPSAAQLLRQSRPPT